LTNVFDELAPIKTKCIEVKASTPWNSSEIKATKR